MPRKPASASAAPQPATPAAPPAGQPGDEGAAFAPPLVPGSLPTAPGPLEVLLALGALTQVATLLQTSVTRSLRDGGPTLLTSAQFAERLGGVTAETVDEWCRQKKFGKFRRAECWGRAGWRIPEYYLWHTDAQWDALVGQPLAVGASSPVETEPEAAASGEQVGGFDLASIQEAVQA